MSYISKTFSRKLGMISAVSFILAAGFSIPAHARDDDEQECRRVVKTHNLTPTSSYTERGMACRNAYGRWDMVADEDHPARVVYQKDGKVVFSGPAYRRTSYDRRDYRHDDDRRDRDRDDHDHDRNDDRWRRTYDD